MIKKKGSQFIVTDSSGKNTLGTHKTKKEAIAQLRAIEASKHDRFADGGKKREMFESLRQISPKVLEDNIIQSTEAMAQEKNKKAALELLNQIRDSGTPEQYQQAVKGYQKRFGNEAMSAGRELFDERIAGNKSVIKGVTDHIDTKGAQKLMSGSDWASKIASKLKNPAVKKTAGALAGAIPLVGGLATALMTGDAYAAIPGLDEAETVGADPKSPEGMFESGQINAEEMMARKEALKRMRTNE